jgi:hypothetical protein
MRTINGDPAEDAEKTKSGYFNWLALLNGVKESVVMPPMCNIQ